MRYKITFFKLSKTRRPNSIATGIDEKSLFNKMIEADFEIGINNNEMMKENKMSSNAHQLPWQRRFRYLTHNMKYQAFGGEKGVPSHSDTNITSFQSRCIVDSVSSLQSTRLYENK
jgi:hypothetical protein